MFVGITFPFFGGLIGFFGGLAFAPTTYFVSTSFTTVSLQQYKSRSSYQTEQYSCLQLPCIMWLIICKPRRFSLSWFTNWVRRGSKLLSVLLLPELQRLTPS
jgi:hypothetical protein